MLIKKNELLIHAKKWMDIKIILLSRTGQAKNNTHCMIPFYNSRQCKLICIDRKQISGGLGYGLGTGRDKRERLQRGTKKNWGEL